MTREVCTFQVSTIKISSHQETEGWNWFFLQLGKEASSSISHCKQMGNATARMQTIFEVWLSVSIEATVNFESVVLLGFFSNALYLQCLQS